MCKLTVFRMTLSHQFGGNATPSARPILHFRAQSCSCTLPTSLLMMLGNNIPFNLHFKEKSAAAHVQINGFSSDAEPPAILVHISACCSLILAAAASKGFSVMRLMIKCTFHLQKKSLSYNWLATLTCNWASRGSCETAAQRVLGVGACRLA